jgi:hypothetical protein
MGGGGLKQEAEAPPGVGNIFDEKMRLKADTALQAKLKTQHSQKVGKVACLPTLHVRDCPCTSKGVRIRACA